MNIIKSVAAVISGICGFLWGQFDGLLYALIAFMALDYISGVIAVTRLKVLPKILPLPFTGNIYYRSYDGSVWSSWYVFTGTAVV